MHYGQVNIYELYKELNEQSKARFLLSTNGKSRSFYNPLKLLNLVNDLSPCFQEILTYVVFQFVLFRIQNKMRTYSY